MADEKLEAKWGDKAASVSGPMTVAAVVVLAAVGFLYLEMRGLSEEHSRILEAIEVIAWLESLPEGQRPELVMPESVSRRLHGSSGNPYGDIERNRARGVKERQR